MTHLPKCQSTRCGDTAEDANGSATGRCTLRQRTAAALDRRREETKNEVIAARVAASCSQAGLALQGRLCDKKKDATFPAGLIEDSHQSVSAGTSRGKENATRANLDSSKRRSGDIFHLRLKYFFQSVSRCPEIVPLLQLYRRLVLPRASG